MKYLGYKTLKWSILLSALCFVACTTDRSVLPGIDASAPAELAKVRGQEFSLAVVRASSSGWGAKDVEQLVSFYTDDAILFPPKGEPIRGKDAIRAFWTRTPDRRLLEHLIETERAEASGELLVEHGRFSLVSQSGQKPPEPGTANFISVWKRGSDGVWRKYLDSWW